MANPRSNRSSNANGSDKPSKSRAPKPTSTPTLAPQQQPVNSSSSLQHTDSEDFVRIDDLPVETLRKYREVHKLENQVSSALSHNGYLLRNNSTSIAKRTFTAKHTNRVSKHELAAVVKRNFNQQTVRESEVIVDFIYSVNKQGNCGQRTL
jgi:histone deacetylase complex subunit SAP30